MSDMGTDVVQRIRACRFNSFALRVTILAPLAFGVILSLVMLIVGIAQGRSRLFASIRDFNLALAILAAVAVPLLFAGTAALLVRSKVRRNLKDFYRETDYDRAEYNSFRSALEGVGLGLGMSPPELEVLGVPTVNSIAFRKERRPRVGVTAEALRAQLSSSEKEAMMAHELAHVALGDYFLASSSAGFEYAGYGLGVLFLLMALLVGIAVNIYLLIFLLPLFAPLLIVLADTRLRKKTKLLYRHNDLLADTIAAKLISDPACLRKAIEKLWTLSEEARGVIPRTAHFQGYLFVARPLEAGSVKMVTYDGAAAPAAGGKSRATKIYWVPGAESRTGIAYDAVENRIANLRAIELGQWTELERSGRSEQNGNIAGLAGVGAVIFVIILALLIPWHGKTAWDYATTHVVWKIQLP